MADNEDKAVQVIPDGEEMPGEDHEPKRVDFQFHLLKDAAPVHDKPSHPDAWNEVERASKSRFGQRMAHQKSLRDRAAKPR